MYVSADPLHACTPGGVCVQRAPKTPACLKSCFRGLSMSIRPWISWQSVIPQGNDCLYPQRVVHDGAGHAGRPHQRDACLGLVQRFPGRAWGKQKGLHEFSEKVKSKCYVLSFSAFLLNRVMCSSCNPVISSSGKASWKKRRDWNSGSDSKEKKKKRKVQECGGGRTDS